MDLVIRFYERLLDLDECEPFEPHVDELLELLVGITGARLAYVDVPVNDQLVFRRAYPRESSETLRRLISVGIMRSTIAARRTTCTQSAFADDRFADLASVRLNQIQFVICTPIEVQGYVGVLYVQAATQATGATEFRADHRKLVEALTRRLGRRLAWPLRPGHTITMESATDALRRWFALEVLEQNGWKGTATATALGISRSTLYELVADLRAPEFGTASGELIG